MPAGFESDIFFSGAIQKQKDSFSCPFVFANATSKFGPTQARKGLKGFAPAGTPKSVPTNAQTEVLNPSTAAKNKRTALAVLLFLLTTQNNSDLFKHAGKHYGSALSGQGLRQTAEYESRDES